MSRKATSDKELNGILDNIERDLKYDESNIDKLMLNLPLIHSKYIAIFSAAQKLYRDLEVDLKELHAKRYKYYKEDYDRRMDNKSEIDEMIHQEKEYIELLREVRKQETVCNFLERSVDNIKNMNYVIKSYVDWKRYQSMMM